jgi:putative CocE/NonD family hydrolase
MRSTQRLVIGPWTHLDWTGRHPAYDAGPSGETDIDLVQLRWFDRWLKGFAPPEEPSVRLFSMGDDAWIGFDRWNDRPTAAFYLASDGRAALLPRSGRLDRDPGPAGSDAVVLDPWRPPPSFGGHAGAPSGRVDRRAIDNRPDLCKFTSAPLTAPLKLAGAVGAELYVSADQPSFDVCAVLSELRPNGAVVNLTQGYRRVEPGEACAPLRIDMRGTAATIPAGTALRLSIAPSAFPGYPVNAGDGRGPAESRRIDQRIATLTVRHGEGAPSRLLLPV